MWIYTQKTGILRHDAAIVSAGCSGDIGECRDNPAMQESRGGPIPIGRYLIIELIDRHPKLGENVLRLEPRSETKTFGRKGFYWHGDTALKVPASAAGCIVTGPSIRLVAWKSGDHEVSVI